MRQRSLYGYVATRVLDTPFWGIYNMLPFILYKDLHASPFQIAALVALKPLLSILSMYWGSHVKDRPDRLVKNIMWARFLGYFPFFLFPFVDNPWFYIFAYALYMALAVGVVPAWMEILKRNLPKETREKTFSYTQAFGYMGGGLLPFVIGWVLDGYFQAWRWLFPLAACVSLSAFFFQRRIVINFQAQAEAKVKIFNKITQPWTSFWQLLKERLDFQKFQIGFMFLGGGLMLMQPAMPIYFTDVLHLTYTELAVALTLCKGVGFALASPTWAKEINRLDVFPFAALIALLISIFPIFLIAAKVELLWLYIGYFCYGIAQAGSELVWNMSGPIFARDKDSSIFTSVNIVTVGIRGAFIPAFGSLLIYSFSSTVAMAIGGAVSLVGSLLFAYYARKMKVSNAV